MLDLRPIAEASPLHFSESLAPAGELDTTGLSADDEAAEAAIERSVRSEWFVRLSARRFSVGFQWRSVADFTAYVCGGRQPKRVRPSCDALLSAWRWPAELRTRRTLILGAYRKPSTRVDPRPGAP